MQAKICGLKTIEQVKACVKNNADFCGFILNYPKSHRFIDYQTAQNLTNIERQNTKFVGVLVDPKDDEIKNFARLNLDYFQIYGDIDINKINEIKKKFKKKIIIALQIKTEQDVLRYKMYKKNADIILFDSTGLQKSLSWNYKWIENLPKTFKKMLAGNISIEMLDNLKKITDIVDVSGALETNKVKDINKIKEFLNKIKQINDCH